MWECGNVGMRKGIGWKCFVVGWKWHSFLKTCNITFFPSLPDMKAEKERRRNRLRI